MSRLTKTDEVIELAIAMQNSYQGLTIDDIAEKFECSRRSAERLKALIVDKFPDKIEEVENTTDRKKRWRFKKGSMNFLINFTSDDFANLEHCKEMMKNSSQQKEIDELISKIKALNPKHCYETDINEILLSRGYAIKQCYREKIKPEVLELINEAILSQKQLKFDYFKTKNIVINPLGIIIADKQYIVSINISCNKKRLYRISKIEQLELLDNYFEKEENFDIREYSNSSFGIFHGEKVEEVKLLFRKNAREDVLEYYFHPTQVIKELDNGDVEVSFRACGFFEIITELLKWRDTVKIISPQELKDEYKSTVKAMFMNL